MISGSPQEGTSKVGLYSSFNNLTIILPVATTPAFSEDKDQEAPVKTSVFDGKVCPRIMACLWSLVF